MVALAGDMNGHVGSSSIGCDGMHGGFWFEARNADGSRILEFTEGQNQVICSTFFMKQESKPMTSAEEGGYVFGAVCLSVCLSVCPSDYSQTCERILTKFFGGVGHGSRTK